jgi:hypothetical protein
MKTDDEKDIEEIEARALHKDGLVTVTEADFMTILTSRLAWKFTAKCFAADPEKINH